MEPWQIAVVLKGFGAVIVLVLIRFFITGPLKRWLPEGRVKRFLFFSWKV